MDLELVTRAMEVFETLNASMGSLSYLLACADGTEAVRKDLLVTEAVKTAMLMGTVACTEVLRDLSSDDFATPLNALGLDLVAPREDCGVVLVCPCCA